MNPEFLDNLNMSVYNFHGQRADKFRVRRATQQDDSEDVSNGKVVEFYTVTCFECGGVGWYDNTGDIVCEDCDLIISGDRQAVLPVDYSGSRGFTEDKSATPIPGPTQPSNGYDEQI